MNQDNRRTPLRLVRFSDPNAAIGMAARLMMDRPAFSRLQFGPWMRVIEGQAQRGHQVFVVDDCEKTVGYLGYSFCSEEIANLWLRKDYMPSSEECREGSCVIVNAFVANNSHVSRLLVDTARRIAQDRRAIYFKRIYGRKFSMRATRLSVNDIFLSHIALAENSQTAPQSGATEALTTEML